MTWEQWKRAVIDQLIDTLQVTNSDAQGIFEAQEFGANEKMAIHIWHANYTPAQAARAIDHASRVKA